MSPQASYLTSTCLTGPVSKIKTVLRKLKCKKHQSPWLGIWHHSVLNLLVLPLQPNAHPLGSLRTLASTEEGAHTFVLMKVLIPINSFMCFSSQGYLCSSHQSWIHGKEFLVLRFHATWSYWQKVREPSPNYSTSPYTKPAEQANQGCLWVYHALSPLLHGATIVHSDRRGWLKKNYIKLWK